MAQQPEITLQEGHSSPVTCIQLSPARKLFITGDESGKINVWETRSLRLLKTIQVSDGLPVRDLHFNPNGFRLFSKQYFWHTEKYTMNRDSCKFWDLYQFQKMNATVPPESYVAFTPDSVKKAILSYSKFVFYNGSDLFQSSEIGYLDGITKISSEEKVTTMEFSTDYKLVFIGYYNGTLEVRNASDLSLIESFRDFTLPVQKILVSKDHLFYYTGHIVVKDDAPRIVIRPLSDLENKRYIDFPDEYARTFGIISASVSKSGGRLACSLGYETLIVYNVEDGREILNIGMEGIGSAPIGALSFLENESRILVTTGQNPVKMAMIDIDAREIRQKLCSDFLQDMNTYVCTTGTENGKIRMVYRTLKLVEDIDLSNMKLRSLDAYDILESLTDGADTHRYGFPSYASCLMTPVPGTEYVRVLAVANPLSQAFGAEPDRLLTYDIPSGKIVHQCTIKTNSDYFGLVDVIPVSDITVMYDQGGTHIFFIDSTGKEVFRDNTISHNFQFNASPDGAHFSYLGADSALHLRNAQFKELARWPVNHNIYLHGCFSNDADLFSFVNTASDGSNVLNVYSLEHKEWVDTMVWHGVITAFAFTADANGIVFSTFLPPALYVRDIRSKAVAQITGNIDRFINDIFVQARGDIIFTRDYSGKSAFWSLSEKAKILEMYLINRNAGIFLTPDSYYSVTSRNALGAVAFRKGNRSISFDQFDLKLNRPDLIIQRMGLADSSLVRAYHAAYLKRLEKMKYTETMLATDYHLPEIRVKNLDEIPLVCKEDQIVLKIKATDSQTNIDRINVWVNEVPIFGNSGVDVLMQHTDSLEMDLPIVLSAGENKVQVSCFNEKGAESFRESIWVKYEPPIPAVIKKYVVIISVSNYQNPEYNLKYAVKDGRDMAQSFAERANSKSLPFSGGAGGGLSIDTLFNQNATRENIIALKQKLMQTRVDDEVILYVSGHGLLDAKYDFYFATYDIDFNKPDQRGILYEDLEGLLEGIPARKKLLLMDACHSGELDKDEVQVKDQQADLGEGKKGDIKTYGYKGTKLTATGSGNQIGLQNSFELMQELFANLTRGSGAVVISAAAGTGYALESAEWNNGVFTYCILNGMKNLAADANGDKEVSVSELKNYVSREVEKLTQGAQKPTSRRESLEFDWMVW